MGEKSAQPVIDGLTEGERLIFKAIVDGNKAELLKLGEIQSSVAECKIMMQNLARNQGTLPVGTTATPHKMTTCGSKSFDGCGAPIYWENRKPFNSDGSAHRCQR